VGLAAFGRASFVLSQVRKSGPGAPGAGIDAGRENSAAFAATPASSSASLLSVLKEELFALESEKLSGTISAAEYAEQKPALETVMKRALKRSSH
jgi:hypothetical protein